MLSPKISSVVSASWRNCNQITAERHTRGTRPQTWLPETVPCSGGFGMRGAGRAEPISPAHSLQGPAGRGGPSVDLASQRPPPLLRVPPRLSKLRAPPGPCAITGLPVLPAPAAHKAPRHKLPQCLILRKAGPKQQVDVRLCKDRTACAQREGCDLRPGLGPLCCLFHVESLP